MPEPTSLRIHRARPVTKEPTLHRGTKTTPTRKWPATLLLASLLGLPALVARAQDAPPPGAPPAAPPAPAEAPPAATPPPPPAPPVAEAPKAAESPPAPKPEALPPIDVGAWTRVGGVFQKAHDPTSVGDWHMDAAYIELHVSGKVHQKVGVTINLNGNLLASSAVIEDAIVSFDFCDPFHLWAGQLLVPVDRANASGPFFMIPWNYPGFLGVGNSQVVAAPKEGSPSSSGRNTGAVLWGQFNGGKLKYLVGAFDNKNVDSSPLFSGRLNLAIIGSEPGFWGNASYFGDADVLAIGVGGQFQKHGSANATTMTDKDWTDVNADILGEFKLPGGGWVTGEAAYYHFGVTDGSVKDTFYVLGALATPKMGVGNIQPMVRYQWANVQNVSTKAWNIDGALAYLIKGPALRVIATYSHVKIHDGTGGSLTGNSVQLGAQAIFF